MTDIFGLTHDYLDAGLPGTPFGAASHETGSFHFDLPQSSGGGDASHSATMSLTAPTDHSAEAASFILAFKTQLNETPPSKAEASHAAKIAAFDPVKFKLHPKDLAGDAADIAAAIAKGFSAGKAITLLDKLADKAHVSFDQLLALTEAKLEAAKGKAADAGEKAFEAAMTKRLSSGEAVKDLGALVKSGKLTGASAAKLIVGEAHAATPSAIKETHALAALLDRMDALKVKESQNEAAVQAYSTLILSGVEQGLKAGGKNAPGASEVRAAAEVMEASIGKYSAAAELKIEKQFASLDDTKAELAFLDKAEAMALKEAKIEHQVSAFDAAKWNKALNPPAPDAISKAIYTLATQFAAGKIDAFAASQSLQQLAQDAWKPGTIPPLTEDLLLKASRYHMTDAQAVAMAKLLDTSFNNGNIGALKLHPALKALFSEVTSVRWGETEDAAALALVSKVAVGFGSLSEAKIRAAIAEGAASAGGDIMAWSLQAFAALGGATHVGDTVAATKVYLALANEMSRALVSQKVIGHLAGEVRARHLTFEQAVAALKGFAKIAFYNEGYDAAGTDWVFKLQNPDNIVSSEGVNADQRLDIALVQVVKLLKGAQQQEAKALLLKTDMNGYLFGLGANGLFKGGHVMTDAVAEARDIIMADAVKDVKAYVAQQTAAGSKPTDAQIYYHARGKLDSSTDQFVEGVGLLGQVVDHFDKNGKLKGAGSIGSAAKFAVDPSLGTVRDLVGDFVGSKISPDNPLELAAGVGSLARSLIVNGSIGSALGPVVSGTLDYGLQSLQVASDAIDVVLDNTIGLVVKPLVDFAANTVVDTVENVGNLVKALATGDPQAVLDSVNSLADDFVHNLSQAGQVLLENLENSGTLVLKAAAEAAKAIAEAIHLEEGLAALAEAAGVIFEPINRVVGALFDIF